MGVPPSTISPGSEPLAAASFAPTPVIAPIDRAALRELRTALGISHVTAQALARRGLTDPAAARRWLAAASPVDAPPLPGLQEAAALVQRHVTAGNLILIHGDYDVDGVCATAILLDVLELLGARTAWHLPKRGVDGYGLTDASLQRIARLSPSLVITVDCGITAVEQAELLADAGIELLITDHHLPRGDGHLPAASILHPAVADGALVEPVGEPCGAGVAAALALAIAGADGRQVPAGLRDGIHELAALATIADCVPLVAANRSLVREGLGALARTRRPGLRALLRSARIDAAALDGSAVGFRLAPRLNAAGRMARADVALSLLRARSDEEGAALAESLEQCNLQRRDVEQHVRFAAEALIREQGERAGYVVAGEDWPAGVIGIVASRLAEQTDRPVVVVGLDGARGVGSARSARGLDLAALMGSCSEHLTRFGGHAQAAGCELEASAVEDFAVAFDAAATEALAAGAPPATVGADAVAQVRDLTLALAEELTAFEPTGEGNPPVRLLLPAVRIEDDRPMSSSEHRRAVIAGGGARAEAVAFGTGPIGSEGPVDVVAELERSTYGGSVRTRVIVRSVHPLTPAASTAAAGKGIDAGALASILLGFEEDPPTPAQPGRPHVDARGGSVAALLRVAQACGRTPIAYVCDPGRRVPQLRSLGWEGRVSGPTTIAATVAEASAADGPVICVDPPIDPRAARALAESELETWWSWNDPELTYAVHVLEREFALRPLMVELYRALRAASRPLGPLDLVRLVPAGGSPAAVGRAARVLVELELAAVDGPALDGLHVVADAPRREQDESATFKAAAAIVEEAKRWTPVTPRA